MKQKHTEDLIQANNPNQTNVYRTSSIHHIFSCFRSIFHTLHDYHPRKKDGLWNFPALNQLACKFFVDHLKMTAAASQHSKESVLATLSSSNW
jgi:hypothetical protein